MATDNWHLCVCGLNHKTSTLSEREPLQIGPEDIARAHAEFAEIAGMREGVIVSTCNRDEFYSVMDKHLDPFGVVVEFYRKFRDIDISSLRDRFYIRLNEEAVLHLFRVTAGIDSMVIGENQIMGQVKDAYSSACKVKSTDKILHRLFHQAFRVGKQVRTDTEMGRGACSISGASMELLKTRRAIMNNAGVLFIGINRMISLAARHLARTEGITFTFANRTLEKAVQFGRKFHAPACSLEEIPNLLPKVDIIVSCTGADRPIITASTLSEFAVKHPEHRLIIIDMAIPRDVEYTKGSLRNIELFDLDDVDEYVHRQQDIRRNAIPDAEEIIKQKLSEFTYWFEHIRREPVYNGLERYFEDLRQEELAELLEGLDDTTRTRLDLASRRLVERLLFTKIRTSK
jgi:glutamyl-tRNA reductase